MVRIATASRTMLATIAVTVHTVGQNFVNASVYFRPMAQPTSSTPAMKRYVQATLRLPGRLRLLVCPANQTPHSDECQRRNGTTHVDEHVPGVARSLRADEALLQFVDARPYGGRCQGPAGAGPAPFFLIP